MKLNLRAKVPNFWPCRAVMDVSRHTVCQSEYLRSVEVKILAEEEANSSILVVLQDAPRACFAGQHRIAELST